MSGVLATNVMHFGRLLRAVGLPAGPGQVLDAVNALSVVDVGQREEFYWALHAVFVTRGDQRELFDQAFKVYWRDPAGVQSFMSMFLSAEAEMSPQHRDRMSRRVREALSSERPSRPQMEEGEAVEIDAVLRWSSAERLRHRDFDQMSAEEMAAAREVISRMDLTRVEVPTRRFRPHPRGGRIDPRATLRATLRGRGLIPLKLRKRRTRPPPLVALCDISGSMGRYSRVLLHFLHTLTNDRDRVYSFVFGTRLTNITRHLRHRDVDDALDAIGHTVEDWEGGTRIGDALTVFNRDWSRRVLGQGAVVLLITDGLDRGDPEVVNKEAERLHKSCRHLIWLNPLLRFAAFEPRARGIQALMPHVDEHRRVHDLESLEQLAAALGG